MPHSAEYAIDFVPNSHVERDSYVDPDSPELRPVEKVPPLAIRVVVPIDHLLLWSSCIIHRAAEHMGSGDKLSTFMYVRSKGAMSMSKADISHPAVGLPAPLVWKLAKPEFAGDENIFRRSGSPRGRNHEGERSQDG
ncbi:hypothetical protein CYMTET_15128 [Cymbomonas tetramitiformis]|uniref:Uncharacterized protein n=1 Tax=Cymbomonas tetramitiformis TaxID=36881 RepID=A0AAE0L9M4_9CHLO|nr:hypothetical protein CYMTET_15128 [Cymbomonas tetramitiformis]